MDCLKPKPNNSLIRFFHASPEMPEVDIYVDDKPVAQNISYMQFSKYINIEKGVHSIEVYVAGEDQEPVLVQNVDVASDRIFTAAFTGNQDNLSIESLEENIDIEPARDFSYLRLVHLAPNTGKLNVLSNGNNLFNGLEFRESTDYMPLPFGDHRFKFVDDNSGDALIGVKVTLNPRRIYSMYIVGDSNDELKVIQSVDGNTYACR